MQHVYIVKVNSTILRACFMYMLYVHALCACFTCMLTYILVNRCSVLSVCCFSLSSDFLLIPHTEECLMTTKETCL